MRVLIVNPKFPLYGGAELVIVRLSNYLVQKGNEVGLLTSRIDETVKKALNPKVKLITTNEEAGLLSRFSTLIEGYDVFNFHNHPAELLAYPVRLPSVWSFNEPPDYILDGGNVKGLDQSIVLEYIDEVVVADNFNLNQVKDLYGVTATINPYGIDYDFWNDGERKEHDGFRIVQTGFFTRTKNQLKSVEVLKELIPFISDVKLIFVGGYEVPNYYNKVKERVKELRLEERVEFKGQVTREELRDIYYSSDVLLHPIKGQGGFLTPFEAMVTGLPVVVSPDMPSSDLIKENKLGFVTRNYADGIKLVYEYRKRFPQNIQKYWVKENLTWDRFCNKMLEIFEEVKE